MGNITENKLNLTIPAADITAITGSINDILDIIPDASLTPDQRSSLLSMDVDNKIFAEDCVTEIDLSGTGIIPPFINSANLKNDITLFEQMDAIEAALINATQAVSDVKRICAHEAMTSANAIYRMFEMANFAGIPGAKQAYDKLKARFKQNGGGNNQELPDA